MDHNPTIRNGQELSYYQPLFGRTKYKTTGLAPLLLTRVGFLSEIAALFVENPMPGNRVLKELVNR